MKPFNNCYLYMNILFLSDCFPPEVNACASRVFERAIYWVNQGNTVTVVTSAPNGNGHLYQGYKNHWRKVDIIEGIKVIRVKTYIANKKSKYLRILDHISYMFSASLFGLFVKKPDIIVATSPQFFTACAGWLLSFFKRKPYVLELSDLWPKSIIAVGAMKRNSAIKIIEKIELFLYHRANTVITSTYSFNLDLISRGISPDKIIHIINGVELNKFKPNKKNTDLANLYKLDNKFIIGYIGTLGMAQGLDIFIKAIELLQNHPHLHFILVGEGVEKSSLIKQTKDLKNITFIPQQEKNNIAKFWDLCDVAAVCLKNNPTFSEVIPSKIFEAMAMEKPIIYIGPEGEASKIIEKHQIGQTILDSDPKNIGNSMLNLYANPKQLENYAINCRNSVDQYSREKQANLMLDVLSSVLSPSKAIKTE